MPSLLLVEDDPSVRSTLTTFLELEGYGVEAVSSTSEALERLSSASYPIVISDIYIDERTGIDVLNAARSADPSCAVILMSARGSMETVMAATRGGAFEYLAKPFELDSLLEVVKRAESALSADEEDEDVETEEPLETEMIGSSSKLVEIYKMISRVAPTDALVLIEGETGTGKELIAHMLHANSLRAQAPFIPVDCGAIPEGIIESELFGHVKGAFTGAATDAPGLIAQSHGGTLFLDEVGELPLNMQTRLLRFLQQKEVRPVGGTKPLAVDARVIAATNRDLREMVKAKTFREDLFYRLNVVNLKLPPLRERRDDIPALLRHFLDKHSPRLKTKVTVSPEAFSLLTRYRWPGNIREMENLVLQLLSLYPGETVRPEMLPGQVVEEGPAPVISEPGELPLSLREYEVMAVRRALSRCKGDVIAASRLLEVGKSTLYRRIGELKIDLEAFKERQPEA